MPSRWLLDLLWPEALTRCSRCGGTGSSPVEAGKLCQTCWGYGRYGLEIARRFDKGCVERYCIHGIGHTVSVEAMRYPDWVHGCDGCCYDYELKGGQ